MSIYKEYGNHYVECDGCGLPLEDEDGYSIVFDSWDDAKQGLDTAGWKTTKDPRTGEWEHHCKECVWV